MAKSGSHKAAMSSSASQHGATSIGLKASGAFNALMMDGQSEGGVSPGSAFGFRSGALGRQPEPRDRFDSASYLIGDPSERLLAPAANLRLTGSRLRARADSPPDFDNWPLAQQAKVRNGFGTVDYLGFGRLDRFSAVAAPQARRRGVMPGTGVYNLQTYPKAYAVWQDGHNPTILSPGERALLELISVGEGTDDATAATHSLGSGYDATLGYGKYARPGKPLTQMTLDEVDALQTRMLANPRNTLRSSAAGKYEIVQSTLRELRSQLGLKGSQLFDADMQDRLGLARLEFRGLGRYRAGGRVDEFQDRLTPEWTSIPSSRTGKAKQHTGMTTAQIQEAIRNVNRQY